MSKLDLANSTIAIYDLVRFLQAYMQPTQLKFVVTGVGVDAANEARSQRGVDLEQPADDRVGKSDLIHPDPPILRIRVPPTPQTYRAP